MSESEMNESPREEVSVPSEPEKSVEKRPRRETEIAEPIVLSPPLSAEEKKKIPCPQPLPMTPEEVAERGWSEVDIIFITGDAYVDHPSFANGLLTRVLEAEGFRVAVLSQPDWQSSDAWKRFGRPRLGFCVSAGNLDSMLNHYTANRKVRNDDAYSPNGQIGLRPDRATLSYCQRAREAYPGVNIIAGGIEASLRRFAHYDYWSDKVKRSILMDSKAGILSYGMGESSLCEIFRRLDAGEELASIRDVRGTAYRIGKLEDLPEETETLAYLPSYEEVREDFQHPREDRAAKKLFAEMTKTIYENLNPFSAKTLAQEHGEEAVIVNPPSLPLSTEEMDRIYGLPFTRKPHPSYGNASIPALDVVKDSVTILRGCFGGCAFCSLTAHQGKIIQSRSVPAILTELKTLAKRDDFGGSITDLGGPTANMFQMGCRDENMKNVCQRPSCLHPTPCPNLSTDHKPLIELYHKARAVPGIKNVFIASGVRTDLALESPEYIEELICHHIGGHLKTAPEHVDPAVLNLMQKPPIEIYEEFCDIFANLTEKHEKELYLVPYLIAGLPGCSYKSMVSVAEYLKANDIRPEQVQDFIPTPFELAGAMYYTGLNPLTGESVYIPRGLRERRLQRALLFYYNPAFYHDVKSALKEARREDLIGDGPECLIPAYPPKIDNLRQSSRVKRLKKQQSIEREAKEKRRQEFIEMEEAKKRNEARRRSSGGRRFRSNDRPQADRGYGRRDENRSRDDRPQADRGYGRRDENRSRDDRPRENRGYGRRDENRSRDDRPQADRGYGRRDENRSRDDRPRENRGYGRRDENRSRDDRPRENRGYGRRDENRSRDDRPRENRGYGRRDENRSRDDRPRENRGYGRRDENRSRDDRPREDRGYGRRDDRSRSRDDRPREDRGYGRRDENRSRDDRPREDRGYGRRDENRSRDDRPRENRGYGRRNDSSRPQGGDGGYRGNARKFGKR